ncbi:DEAD-domain-containing protein [Auriculariales sp. MPI-PUGE-AT-0066]|nr:DEAD-domain-containing protein [Auriculariales sp. MPI-PUGE-AT-0066]
MAVAPAPGTKPRVATTAGSGASSDVAHKIKTATKVRYLKKKKDKRKKRIAAQKATAPKTQTTPAQISTEPTISSPATSKNSKFVDDQGADVDVDMNDRPRKKRRISLEPDAESSTATEPSTASQLKKLNKSKKRSPPVASLARATSPSAASSDNDFGAQSDSSGPTDSSSRAPSFTNVDDRDPPPPSTLPAFPLPVQPAPPSATELGRQGLDSALLAATKIDGRQTLSLSDVTVSEILSERIRKRLVDMGIKELFAVQTALVPHLLPQTSAGVREAQAARVLYRPYELLSDICVSAPTGSGKTLAYAIPIVEVLAPRIVMRLRALVVLPTRDLVAQVRETFESLAKGTGLRVGSITGAQSFAVEQAGLVDKKVGASMGESKVDILICTPGRLIDHLDGTPGFTLTHLRFLVIDEADRLLAQSFQDWLARVRHAIEQPTGTDQPTILAPHLLPTLPMLPAHPALAPKPSAQKLLLSATLTRDPGRLNALGLVRPRYFVVTSAPQAEDAMEVDDVDGEGEGVDEEFGASLPTSLQERMVVCETADKPLVLAHLIGAENDGQALVFCKSVEAAARLATLLTSILKTASILAYSSDAPRSVLERFRKGEVNVLVCSDLVSRGLDVASVRRVFSYDAPLDMRKYVHRAGRTARAGRTGEAWTLLETQEARHFKAMLREGGRTVGSGGGKIKKVNVEPTHLDVLREGYDVALERLAELYGRGG